MGFFDEDRKAGAIAPDDAGDDQDEGEEYSSTFESFADVMQIPEGKRARALAALKAFVLSCKDCSPMGWDTAYTQRTVLSCKDCSPKKKAESDDDNDDDADLEYGGGE